MKKKLLLSLVLMVFVISSKAQSYVPFPTAGATWRTYYYGTCSSMQPPDTSITEYSLTGDTITIHGNTCYKLYSNTIYPTLGPTTYAGALREEKKKIYFYNGPIPEDTLLYDFNAVAGDSVYVFVDAFKSPVLAVDSILIGTAYNRRLQLRGNIYNGETEYWIEGVGSSIGLVTNTVPLPTCGTHHYELLCFKQDGITKYLNPRFLDCDATKPITAITAPGYLSRVSIYPNPTITRQVHIDNIIVSDHLLVKVSDYTGKIILSQPLNHRENTIDLPTAKQLYFLMITNQQGKVLRTQKIWNQ
jgi:hypothetical protein